jgi:hypothetical protein
MGSLLPSSLCFLSKCLHKQNWTCSANLFWINLCFFAVWWGEEEAASASGLGCEMVAWAGCP